MGLEAQDLPWTEAGSRKALPWAASLPGLPCDTCSCPPLIHHDSEVREAVICPRPS